MKKVVTIIVLILVFLILYLLQSNFFNWFTLAGIQPNLFVIFILFIGLFAGKYVGAGMGIACGLLLDVFIGKNVGVSAIMLGLVGFLAGYLDKNFSKESRMTIMLMVLGATLFYEIGNYIIQAFIFSYTNDVIHLIVTFVVETIYNIILTIILYPLMQKTGYAIEDTFKGRKILTRYF